MATDRGYSSAAMSIGTVTQASGTILAANVNRRYLRIDNTGGTACYLGLGGAAVINQGPRVNGLGTADSSYEMSQGKGNLFTGAITAVLSVTGTALFGIVEGS